MQLHVHGSLLEDAMPGVSDPAGTRQNKYVSMSNNDSHASTDRRSFSLDAARCIL